MIASQPPLDIILINICVANLPCQSPFLNPAQSYAITLGVDAKNADGQDVAYCQAGATRHLAAMEEAILFDANVDKGPKVNHITHGAREVHTRLEIIHGENVTA